MEKNYKTDDDEINLIELMVTLWEGKWKVAAAVIISLIAVISYQSTKTKNFTAITEIRPIRNLELNKFYIFNNLIENPNPNTGANTNTNTDANANTGVNTSERFAIAEKATKMSSSNLLNLYLDVLKDGTVFESAIRKFNLLEDSQYNNEQKYSEAIIILASSIKILSASAANLEFEEASKKSKTKTAYNTISFTYHDAAKWKSVLRYVDKFTNKIVKNLLIEEYNNNLLLLETNRKFKLEDISIKINNHLIDYERETSDHLAYLKEQSAIAKKLGIARNTFEVQTFGNQNELVSNVKTDSPFYLRGYDSIDKEIELIELRTDKKAFIRELFKLEKKKRAIEQDQSIERVKLALQLTLPLDNNKFSAASINSITTKFEYEDNNIMRVVALVIGLIVGVFYVIISNVFQSYGVKRKIRKKD